MRWQSLWVVKTIWNKTFQNVELWKSWRSMLIMPGFLNYLKGWSLQLHKVNSVRSVTNQYIFTKPQIYPSRCTWDFWLSLVIILRVGHIGFKKKIIFFWKPLYHIAKQYINGCINPVFVNVWKCLRQEAQARKPLWHMFDYNLSIINYCFYVLFF